MRACFVIPAHNEAGLIGDAVQRLAGRADAIYVIADHCSDPTARVASEAGAIVYERHEGVGGKGGALAWFVGLADETLQEYDFVVLLDADSRLGEGFVAAMSHAFQCGAVAAQGFVRPVGAGRSTISALAAYSELLSQEIGDRIRSRLGWTVHLRGKGMAFRPRLLARLVGHLQTRTEDIEMSLWLAGRRIRVWWVPQATVYDPQPDGAQRASRQRARWLHGQVQVWRLYWRDICRLAATGGPEAWALLWAVLAKPKTLVFVAKLALALLLLVLGRLPGAAVQLWSVLMVFVGLSLAVDLAYYLAGLFLVRDRGFYARALLAAPLYVVVWLRGVLWTRASGHSWLRARD